MQKTAKKKLWSNGGAILPTVKLGTMKSGRIYATVPGVLLTWRELMSSINELDEKMFR